ncbi:MAG: 1-acyl-sn-glycerol-3-phosphate acyltransferase [Gammaproteobacteria bacterium HGW-Gammaproteobacteria-14]|nr:MAG: 1-acyl-sn-glycerol-3-phosphate acyltransferase [Gammaproteobacteria bacterium HGW-Gammaproteobacteria-14]
MTSIAARQWLSAGRSIWSSLWPEIRRCWRLLRIVVHIFYGLLLALFIGAFWRPYRPMVQRATRHWIRVLMPILGVDLDVQGRPTADTAFVVSNHVSWLDIPLLGGECSVHFLSKAEVRDWPLIGLLAQAIGTLFIRRGAGESQRKGQEIADHLLRGRTVLVFPEGTTTDGHEVRRFFPQLFVAPVLAGVPVQPVAIRYLDDQGDVDTSLAFIGDDAFEQHLWQLLRRDRIRARVTWGNALVPSTDREVLCHAAWEQVSSLLGSSRQ